MMDSKNKDTDLTTIIERSPIVTILWQNKEHWPVNLLKSENGKHFQPELVDIFITKLPKILEMTKSLTD